MPLAYTSTAAFVGSHSTYNMSQTLKIKSQHSSIPVPLARSVYWAQLRMQVLPVIMFLGVIGVVVYLWLNLDGGGIPAVSQGLTAAIVVPRTAVVQELRVTPYQWVNEGEVVATLVPVEDPRLEVDLLQSELQLARLRIEPSLADRNAIDFERLRVETLRLRQELATAEVELTRAESALKRNEALRGDKLVSEDDYDLSLRDRDLYRAEIAEKREALNAITKRMDSLRAWGEPDTGVPEQRATVLLEQIDAKLAQAGQSSRFIELRAPMSGMVNLVSRQNGEIALEGESLISVQASHSDRIVGYLRQPYPVEPEVGMKVEVLTRTRTKQRFMSQVRQVGAQMEFVTNSLAFLRPGLLVDAGLPVVVDVPQGVTLRPGETVDLIFQSASLRAAAHEKSKTAL